MADQVIIALYMIIMLLIYEYISTDDNIMKHFTNVFHFIHKAFDPLIEI